MKVEVKCDYCGASFEKYQSRITAHNFCCRACKNAYSSKKGNPNGYNLYRDFSKVSKHMHELNMKLNSDRMTPEVRDKLRKARLNTGSGKSYRKLWGRHEHRIVAEKMLGRALKPGEVVHHIDSDKRNNAPENLMVFSSQSEHVKWHKTHSERGNAN